MRFGLPRNVKNEDKFSMNGKHQCISKDKIFDNIEILDKACLMTIQAYL